MKTFRIVAIIVVLTSIVLAEEDVTKIPAVAASIAAYNKALETSDETEAKAIEKANKDNEERKAAVKKRLLLSLRQTAATSKDGKAIKEYADSLEKDTGSEVKPSLGDDKEKHEPIKLTVPMDQWAQGTFATDVKKGQTVKITASGKWYFDRDTITDADGRKDKVGRSFTPDVPGGALCGIFKDGEKDPVKFVVGSKFIKKFNVDGKLYLTGNGGTMIPSGQIEVTITISE